MPQTFVAPSGREYEWQGDSQPTQADIDAIVAYENEIVAREKAEARRAERPRGLSGKPEPVVEPFRPDPAQIRPQVTAGAAAGALAGATGKQPPQLPSFRAAFGSDALKSKAAAKFFDKPQAKAAAPKPPAPAPRQAIDDQLRRAFEERAIVPRQGETQEQFQVRQAIAQKAAVTDGKKTPEITTIQEQRSRGIEARDVPPEELEQAVFEEMIALPEDELRSLVDERRTIWERNKNNYTAFKDYEQAQAALEEKLGFRRLFDPINALRGLQLQAHKAVVRDDIPATERLVALVNTVEGVVTAASLGSKSVLFDPAIHGLKAAGRVLKPALTKALQAAGKYTSSAKVAVERAVKSLDDKNMAAFRNALERLDLTDAQLEPVVDDVVKHVEDLSAKLDDATAKQVEGDVPGAVYRSAHQIDTSTSRNVGDIWSIDDDVARIRGKYGLTNSDHKDIKRLKKIIGKPDDDVVVYRASPVNELNSGDWVTTDLIYANDIKRQNGGRVYKYTVKVGDLRLPANLEDNPSSARFSAFQFIKTNEEPGVVIVPKPPKPKQVEGDVPGAVQVKQAEVSAEEGAGRVQPETQKAEELTEKAAEQEFATVEEVVLSPDVIQVHPEIQYKSGLVDRQANVTAEYKGVNVYDVDQGGELLLWQSADGTIYVVNGHHRLDMAKRAKRFITTRGSAGEAVDAPRKVRGVLLRESNGWTLEQARAQGALENIRDGKGNALDAVRVMRDLGLSKEDLAERGTTFKSKLGRNVDALMDMDSQALSDAYNGLVREDVAAGIGSAKLTPPEQRAAMSAAMGMQTFDEGAILGERTKRRGIVRQVEDSQGSMFGDDENFQVYLVVEAEAAKIEHLVRQAIKRDRQDLLRIPQSLLEDETIHITERTRLAREYGESAGATKDAVSFLLEKDAVLNDTITNWAKRVLNNEATIEQAAADLTPKTIQALRTGIGRFVSGSEAETGARGATSIPVSKQAGRAREETEQVVTSPKKEPPTPKPEPTGEGKAPEASRSKPTKAQDALAAADSDLDAARQAMLKARAKATRAPRSKKTGGVSKILPEEIAYAKAWVKRQALVGAVKVDDFIRAAVKEIGGTAEHWKRVWDNATVKPKIEAPNPPKPVEDAPRRSTGIANVVQDQEALEGIIREVEKGSGKSAKYWAEKGESILSGHESGKAIHAEGDYIALARRIAAEETPATGERIGIILAGKARMLRKVLDVQDTIRKLVDDGADKKLIGAAKRDLEAVETQLADYLTDVQVGKGIWSDVGRAMQGGIDIDYGNYVDVLERFIRSGRKPTEREAKQLSAAVNDYQQYVKKVVPSYDPAKETAEQAIQRHIDEQIQKAKAEYILKEVTGKSKPKSGRSLKEIRKSRETTKAALRSAFRKALKPDIGSGLGSLESLIEQAPEIVRLLKRYIAEWVEERVAIKASAELDDLYKHLRDELPDMLEEGADVTDRDIQRLLAGVYDEVAKPRSEVARQVAELKRQSKLLENIDRVTEGDELLLAKTPAESSKKVKRLRTLYNALRVSMGRVDSPPGARQRVEKVIADLDAQLKGEYRNIKTKRVVTNKDLKDQAQSLRKTMRLKDTIYELEDRLRTGSLQKPPKEVKELTLEQQNLQARADILRNRVRSQLREANRSTGMNVAHAAASLFRGLKLGQDLGQIRRQGLFVSPLSRTFWVAISKAGKSAFSEEAEHRFLREIEERVLPGQRFAAPIRKKAGLSLTTDVVSTEEELSIGRFLSTFKWTRPFARPLERFQRVFINSARADVFDYSVLAGRTDNELLHRARFINNATGRGNVKRVPELLQIVMTSSNYEFSRWGMIGEIPRNPARFLSDLAHGRGVNMGVVDNMRQMATTVGELLGIAGIASMAGYRINLDGDSSDFLKLRKYDDKGKPTDEVWDLTAGIGVRLRDIFRTGKAFGGAEYNKAFDSLIGKTAVRTISPGVRGPVELASVMGQRLKGVENPTSFFTSFESEETGWSLITPLIWQQAYEAYQRGEPPSRQAFLDALEQYSKELVGTGPQYYKPPQLASTLRIPKELQ